jgi:DNA-binding beta-propeller fold protein YncE
MTRSMVAAAVLFGMMAPAWAQMLIVGNDEKSGYDAALNATLREPGHDTLSLIDIANPAMPKVAATIPLMNSVIGPPTNLAIAPSGGIALVANSVKPKIEGWGRSLVPDDRVFIVDLKATPPKQIGVATVGKQPSGIAISPKGDLALVADRGAGTISVLSIHDKDVIVAGTVAIGSPADQVSAVAICPDGRHALATKAAADKVALLSIDGAKVTYTHRDLPVGIFPYNIAISPNGRLALTADNGNGGSSDGNADTVSVIDLAADPPRVIDHVTVGDSPEGLAFSPRGDLAVAVEARGSNKPKSEFFHHPTGAVTVLRIDGTKVTNAGSVDVGALPEAVAFSPDGSHLYVGNFIDGDISVLKVEGDKLTPEGQPLKLPGHPASMRGGPQ